MPRSDSSWPRKKLPPPMTTATWTPDLTTSAICRATSWTTSGSTPTCPPPNISPPSFSRTRFQFVGAGSIGAVLPADREADELVQGDPGLVKNRLDRLLVVTDVGLLEQDVVLVEGVDPALDD